jgi:signal peptidase I
MKNLGDNKNGMSDLKEWVFSIVIAVVLALFIRHFIVELYVVEGPSMLPTLTSSERIVVNKALYYLREPQKGEIVILRYSGGNVARDFIKRVIALPSDTVRIKDGQVFVNGFLIDEDYILEPTKGLHPEVTVPAGHYYVMGDNRGNSEDSRFKIGFVPREDIKGKAVLVFWPLDNLKALP